MTNASPVETKPARPRGRPRKTADERDGGNRRRELLLAAAHLFRHQGFAATSTRDIAAAAGMQAGSPFYHFENKQVLLAAVMQEGMHSALLRQAASLAPLTERHPAKDRLRALVRNHFEVLLGDHSDFVPVMLYEWRALDATQMEAITALKDRYEAAWVPALQQLHASGHLAGDPGLVRLMIFGAMNWSVQWYQVPSAARNSHANSIHQRHLATLDELTTTALMLFLKTPA
ncbi:TetR/AcrR family transcriptional regulator [Hydrogenophaga sp. PAMC20947]|uniref:TetR/AcrR family transcriptional regulator n=1 Tax=Hydrogenophaga sp. PAMC20947 TaxID=2565558 RepID=UPI00109DF12F|nr:TetR/AcrR family transcriptional regulator [Hydrogenophaga sp. PAMC20947]QCB48154.1 TetR/AcrR family transcriptional regulator [Hydrogenophaga sp. PAMC20947]